jgi:hypothetical protein
MYLFNRQTGFTAALLLSLTACGGDGYEGYTAATSVDVFDGAAIGCTVSYDGTVATEVGDGAYTFATVLDNGSVVTAIGCTDSDTQSLLPIMSGVVQSVAVVISPITTLIVEAAIADLPTGAKSIATTALQAAIARIVANLGLGDYQPTDPATANYVAAAKADTTGTSTEAVAMRVSLAISTLLKSVEVSAGPANASAAVAAVSQAIVNSLSVVDLSQSTSVEAVMTEAKTLAPTVATAIQTASDAAVTLVTQIINTPGDIMVAIKVTTIIADFLNTADETTMTNESTLADLVTTASEAAGVTVTVVPAPLVTVSSSTSTQIKLAWNAITGATSYNVYRATESFGSSPDIQNYASFENSSLTQDITELAYTDTVVAGLTYYYVVTAVSSGVESAAGSEVSAAAQSKLNDTGLTWGGDYTLGNNADCIGEAINQQDCKHGRDFTHNDDSDGHAGFSFTKLDVAGNPLAASEVIWSCVKDNVTGLIWEVKTDDSGIHDKDNTYRWGGETALLTESFGTVDADWDALVDGSNTANLCGFNDWRVPSRIALESIVNFSVVSPSIDTDYFLNTPSSNFWSASAYANNSAKAWTVNFQYGYSFDNSRNNSYPVRLVRGGQ